MTSHQLACIYEVRDQINSLHSIPTTYGRLLEDRLVIACSEFNRHDRSKNPRSTREIKARHAQKKAHKVYLHVLDEDPQIFLPFLLIINTDTGCGGFDLTRFCEHHVKRASLHLSRANRAILRDIARRRGIGSSIAFQKLIQALFPTTTASESPTTTADGPEAWRYQAAVLEVVRSQFAISVCEAIAKAPAVGESVQYSTRTTTGSVRMEFPSFNTEDCILWLHVGDVELFESVLFPATFRIQESGNGK